MANVMQQLQAIRDAEITRLRAEAGYPTDDSNADPIEMSVIWKYIESLENTVVAQRLIMDSTSRALRP